MISSIVSSLRKHTLLSVLFVFYGLCLLVGDGQQMVIDIVGAGGVLCLTFYTLMYEKRHREMPAAPIALFALFLSYVLVRTAFSDDVGYSVYAGMRYIGIFLIFYLNYCFLSDEDVSVLPKYIVGFSVISLLVSFVYIAFPQLAGLLPNTNLLIPSYGHNNIVDVLLFGIPIAYMGVVKSKNMRYLVAFIWLLAGMVLSFARGVMLVVLVYFLFSSPFLWKYISVKKRTLFIFFSICIAAILGALLFLPQQSYSDYITRALQPKMAKEVRGANYRFEYYRQAVESIKERPFFGSGPGTFYLQSLRLQHAPNSFSRYAHNELLQGFSEVGVVGMILVFLFLVWSGMRIWTILQHKNQQNTEVVMILLSIVVLQVMNATIDFSMSYLLVAMLFVTVLAGLLTFQSVKNIYNQFLIKCVLFCSIAFLLAFYTIMSLCLIPLSKTVPLVHQCCFLSEYMAKNTLGQSNDMVEPVDIAVIERLHKKNFEISRAIAHRFTGVKKKDYLERVIVQNPKNIQAYRDYFTLDNSVMEVSNYDQILLLSHAFLAEEMYVRIKSVLELMRKDVGDIDFKVDFSQAVDMPFFIAKYLYKVGYTMVDSYPHFTRDLWVLSAELNPSLSYYRVELASLYVNVFGDETNMYNQFQLCLFNKTAEKHCLERLDDIETLGIQSLPPVGSYKDTVFDYE